MTGGITLGAIEAGGTKFLCAVRDEQGRELARTRVATRDPASTVAEVVAFFAPFRVARLGLASFGPIALDEHRGHDRGTILCTPKPAWQGFGLVRAIETGLRTEVVVETDVNAAALAEFHRGAGIASDPLLYVTVGTGVGGGVVLNGRALHGLVHPEMGHVLVPLAPNDPFRGACPFHGACLEGLVSGPAIAARTGFAAHELPGEHPTWELVAHYLGVGLATLVLVLSPAKIVLGGGVASRQGVREHAEAAMRRAIGSYVNDLPSVVAPRFDDAGLQGAFWLAGAP